MNKLENHLDHIVSLTQAPTESLTNGTTSPDYSRSRNEGRRKTGRARCLKLSIISIVVALIATYSLSGRQANAFTGGPPAEHTGAPGEQNCTVCHSSYEINTGTGTFRITGLPESYTPGQEVSVTVTLDDPSAVLYGFELTALDGSDQKAGTLIVTDAMNTQVIEGEFLNRSYVEHTFDGTFQINPASWTFTWKAPEENVGPVTFYAMGNSANGDGVPTDDYIYSASASIPSGGSPSVNLAVSQTDSPDPVVVNNNLSYTVNVTNLGLLTGTGVTLTDTLPAGVTFVSATPSQGSCAEEGGTVTCALGDLASSAAATVEVVVTPTATGEISNTASVTGNETDSDPSNNTATQLTTVIDGTPPAIELEPVLTGLSSPLYVTNARDGGNRIFILERGGRIKLLQPGETTPTIFLDITARVRAGGEQGLLGLAFHPQFAANGRFFVQYTRRPDTNTNVIAEYRVSLKDPNVADPDSEIVLLTIPQPFSNHNGGMVEFGPDGYLYIAKGDGGSANDPFNNAQNPQELLGKLLRIDVDQPCKGLPYSSPPDNPFLGTGMGRDEIFAFGLRNPWRFSFDRATGELYVGDVGQGAVEEVDIVTLGGNYGWRVFEGTRCANIDPSLCIPESFISPIAEYGHTGGRCSITGGYVYRGERSSLPVGTYVFADYCTGEIFRLQNGAAQLLLDTPLAISSFGEDEAGEIYVVALGGAVYRIRNPGVSKVGGKR
jgi:uncharacterized repeat protein (TIGR01451 family)